MTGVSECLLLNFEDQHLQKKKKKKKAKGRDYAISHSFMPMLLLHIPIYTEFYTTNFGINFVLF